MNVVTSLLPHLNLNHNLKHCTSETSQDGASGSQSKSFEEYENDYVARVVGDETDTDESDASESLKYKVVLFGYLDRIMQMINRSTLKMIQK